MSLYRPETRARAILALIGPRLAEASASETKAREAVEAIADRRPPGCAGPKRQHKYLDRAIIRLAVDPAAETRAIAAQDKTEIKALADGEALLMRLAQAPVTETGQSVRVGCQSAQGSSEGQGPANCWDL